MEIRDLEYQQPSLELVNDVTAESIVGGDGSTIILSTTGTLLVFNTGRNTIQTSNQSFASIAGTFPSLTVGGGTLIQAFIRPF
ncbi:MAG: hypothetical protein KME60_18875 [Cyanomargarita calcarea GSE-NOS-MK-12-04C]|uniref:Uncharacterized protein n=1 Tax=Cyanomargarita calcarea GSE-NOS-MK-12-04C TaxID=2839659 RepID=A0A951UW05_9CYAN|nr:hypothetical protein [Cyanomargarita calcarea GSE-NOS-MK-12-04C]